MKIKLLLAVASLAVSLSSHAVQTGITLKKTQLQAEPQGSAETLSTLKKGQPLEFVTRKGSWYQIKTADQQLGWVKMLNVKFTAQGSKQKSLESLNLITGRSSSGVSTGIRGLGTETLNVEESKTEANSAAPASHVDDLEKFKPSLSDIEKFANDGELKQQDIEHISQ